MFNGSSASTVIRDGYFLNNKAVYQLLVDTKLDKAVNYGYDGATMQMVGVMENTALSTTSHSMGLTFANLRFGMKTADGKLVLDAIGLQGLGEQYYLANGIALPLTTGEQTTLTLTVDRPTDTRNFYTYDYGKTGAVRPSEAQIAVFVAAKLLTVNSAGVMTPGNNFFVTHTATYDGETVTAVTEKSVTKDDAYALANYRPVYAEFEGQKYIVGAVYRATDASGVEPYWHDVTTDPGYLGLYENGEALYENDAVRFPNNAGFAASTYWRLCPPTRCVTISASSRPMKWPSTTPLTL